MVYMNVNVSRHLKEDVSWAIDKQLKLIINTMFFQNSYTTKNLKIKPYLILNNIVCISM